MHSYDDDPNKGGLDCLENEPLAEVTYALVYSSYINRSVNFESLPDAFSCVCFYLMRALFLSTANDCIWKIGFFNLVLNLARPEDPRAFLSSSYVVNSSIEFEKTYPEVYLLITPLFFNSLIFGCNSATEKLGVTAFSYFFSDCLLSKQMKPCFL